MRVCLVHQGREHLGLEYISAVLKENGHEVSLAYEPDLFGINDNVLFCPPLKRLFDRTPKVMQRLEEGDYDVVAFTTYTSTYAWALSLARFVKERRKETRTVFGGIHVTLVPEEAISHPQVDYVVLGEGEEAVVELMDRLERDVPPRGVANVWYREGQRVVRQGVRPPISDLDRLPFPDKSLFEEEVCIQDDYTIVASRGCPFSCTYCCESHINALYKGRFYRRRSVESVLEELRAMKSRYGFREVFFVDPILFADKVWLRELMRGYREEIGVPFRCFGRVDFCDREVSELLRWGGCYAVEFGLQTLNEGIRRQTLGRREGNSQYIRAFEIMDEVGVRYDIDHILGIPGESLEDHKKAASFYSSLRRLNRIKCHKLTYFPGLRIVDKALESGALSLEEVRGIERGEDPSDFFHRPSGATMDRTPQGAFETLFKLLPVLPGGLIDKVIVGDGWRWFHRVPFPVVVLGQLAVALKGRDYRFALYFKYYLLRVRRAMGALPRLSAWFIASLFSICAIFSIPLGDSLVDRGVIHLIGIACGVSAVGWVLKGLRGNKGT